MIFSLQRRGFINSKGWCISISTDMVSSCVSCVSCVSVAQASGCFPRSFSTLSSADWETISFFIVATSKQVCQCLHLMFAGRHSASLRDNSGFFPHSIVFIQQKRETWIQKAYGNISWTFCEFICSFITAGMCSISQLKPPLLVEIDIHKISG